MNTLQVKLYWWGGQVVLLQLLLQFKSVDFYSIKHLLLNEVSIDTFVVALVTMNCDATSDNKPQVASEKVKPINICTSLDEWRKKTANSKQTQNK